MYDDEIQTWLTIPRWLWRLAIPTGAALIAFLGLLFAGTVAVISLSEDAREAWIATVSDESPPAPPTATTVTVPPGVEACPSTFSQSSAGELTCACGPNSARGAVWGSEVYTSDSSICAAARHAGVVDDGGGQVHVRAADGCGSYAGSLQNGVTTSSWGEYPSSFFFPQVSQGSCAAEQDGRTTFNP